MAGLFNCCRSRVQLIYVNVKVDPPEIKAIYRIRGKIGEARPVIVKLVNSEVKYRIIRGKKNLRKNENVRLVDDVTKHKFRD
jgi:hypothetical protein